MPHMVFAFVLGYICLSHIYRAYVDYMGWSLDFTGPQVKQAFAMPTDWLPLKLSRNSRDTDTPAGGLGGGAGGWSTLTLCCREPPRRCEHCCSQLALVCCGLLSRQRYPTGFQPAMRTVVWLICLMADSRSFARAL